MKISNQFKFGIIYLILIPIFAIIYNTFFKHDFYYSTITNELAFKKYANEISSNLLSAVDSILIIDKTFDHYTRSDFTTKTKRLIGYNGVDSVRIYPYISNFKTDHLLFSFNICNEYYNTKMKSIFNTKCLVIKCPYKNFVIDAALPYVDALAPYKLECFLMA